MSAKQHILNSIAATAKQIGRTPSLKEFLASVEFSTHHVYRYFSKWNDAVRAAGLRPRRSLFAAGNSELLQNWGKAVRRSGALLSRRAYLVSGEYHPRTLERRFGSWEGVPEAFRRFARGKPEWNDVLALLASPLGKTVLRTANAIARPHKPTSRPQRPLSQTRLTYGDPIDFRGLRHEPVNEQGVVLLFGMLAKELGYLVETVQMGFPDCEAKRQIGPNRWQRVNIEFEFESRNFRDHGHPTSGCDVIVFWRHNWAECPKHIDVVELSSVVKTLAGRKE